MTVYADVLITINTFINFFLLLICVRINRQRYKKWRLILGAFVGGIFSLTIFLSYKSVIIDAIIKIISAVAIVLVSFGFKRIKPFLRNVAVLFIVTFLFAGVVFAAWYLFKPQKILIHNSVVYFDISVLFLIIITIAVYLIITIILSFLKKEAITSFNCQVTLILGKKSVLLNTMLDSGNSLFDPLSDMTTIIVDSKKLSELCGKINYINIPDRYRLIPCRTVSGDVLLEGVRCDIMQVEYEGNCYVFDNTVAVISKTEFTDNFDAILNPEILI